VPSGVTGAGVSVGLGGAGSPAILAGACYSGHIGWLWLGLWDGVKGGCDRTTSEMRGPSYRIQIG
jgi:hypothetical protein